MRPLQRALVAVASASALALLVGCSNASTSEPRAESTSSTVAPPISVPTPTGTTPTTDNATLGSDDDPVRVAIVGDSLTAGGSRVIPRDGLDANTWMTYARGNGIEWVGGWAMGGTTTEIEAANVTPIEHVDVLVLMSGTNNVRLHISFSQAARYYEQIVKTIKPTRVIIGAIPPYDHDPAGAARYERQLKRFVLAKGWDFTDPWRFARDGEVYRGGVSVDGIHPTTAGYKTVGREFRDAILRVVSTPLQG